MSWTLWLCLLGAQLALAAPQATPPAAPSSPCAAIRSFIQKSPDATPQIPAQLAWDCMQDVPINTTAAVPWLQSLKPYLTWQTTLAYLKNPPPQSTFERFDILHELDWMTANIDVYHNEWDFEYTLYRLFQRSGDGHLRYIPNLIGGVFLFGRPVALVSVSYDGHSLPRPYVYSDMLLAAADPMFQPSPIALINGEDAVIYLETLSQYGSLSDNDALYNDVMYNLAQLSLGQEGNGAGIFAGGGRGGLIYPNATTELTFENGTTTSLENFARVLRDFTGISSGQDVYDQYLTKRPIRAPSSKPPNPPSAPAQVPAPGYPKSVIGQLNNYVRGFYLDGPGYEDVAVLTVGKFLGQDLDQQSFQRIAFDFLAQSKAEGKARLIIDLRADGGGTVLHGHSLFTNLFPDLLPYGATRFRAHESFDIIGQTVSEATGPVYPWNISDPPGPGLALNAFLSTPFAYRADVDLNYQDFSSWKEKYGPHEFNGDLFSSVIRWNLSDPTHEYVNGFTVNGFLDRQNIVTERPYLAENIVLLYDGYCASTCAIFSELMVNQGHVKTVAVGGTPRENMPMQGVGGTKGTNTWTWNTIYTFVKQAYNLSSAEQRAAWSASQPGWYSVESWVRSADNGGSVNVRDGIRYGDISQTPLQFVRDLADCRIWYEPDFTVDVTPLWKRVVDVTWGGVACVDRPPSSFSKRDEQIARGKRHQRRSMAHKEINALHEGMNLFTDFRHLTQAGDAEMLP